MKFLHIHWQNGKVTTHPEYEAKRLNLNALLVKRMSHVSFVRGY